MFRRLTFVAILGLVLLQACSSIEYSPNQSSDSKSPRDINKKSLEKLAQTPGDDTIRFVLTGDSQREYKYAEKLVKTVNEIPGVDFVLLAGDISDFGLLQEMEWVHSIFSKLQMPYIGVIGNHDLVANGEDAYKKMFGPLNFSFVYQGVKFICHNTNSREDKFSGNVPDLPWLAQELMPQDDVYAYIPVGHVPPDGMDFDPRLVEGYTRMINASPNTLAALYSHTHSHDIYYFYGDPIPYLITDAIENRQFMLIEIINGKLNYKNIEY